MSSFLQNTYLLCWIPLRYPFSVGPFGTGPRCRRTAETSCTRASRTASSSWSCRAPAPAAPAPSSPSRAASRTCCSSTSPRWSRWSRSVLASGRCVDQGAACGSGGSAGWLVTEGLLVQSLAPPRVSRCPWARRLTREWMCASLRGHWWEKCHIKCSPFTVSMQSFCI